jgi:hypothetical protein
MDEIHTNVGERGISRVFFNIVPTDIDAFVPPLHELEEPLVVKVSVLGTDECSYGCLNVFIGGETVPFECPLQSREEVEVAGCQVGTLGGVVQVLPPEGGNVVGHYCCRVGSRIVQKDDSCHEKARSLPSNGIFQLCQCLTVVFGIDGSPLPSSPSSLQKIQQKNPFSIPKHSQKHLSR